MRRLIRSPFPGLLYGREVLVAFNVSGQARNDAVILMRRSMEPLVQLWDTFMAEPERLQFNARATAPALSEPDCLASDLPSSNKLFALSSP